MEAVQVCLLVPAVFRAAKDDIAFLCDDEDQLLLPVQAAENRVVLSLPVPHFDRHANAAIRVEVEDQNGVAHPGRTPVKDDEVCSLKIREVKRTGLVAHREIAQRTIIEVADI